METVFNGANVAVWSKAGVRNIFPGGRVEFALGNSELPKKIAQIYFPSLPEKWVWVEFEGGVHPQAMVSTSMVVLG